MFRKGIKGFISVITDESVRPQNKYSTYKAKSAAFPNEILPASALFVQEYLNDLDDILSEINFSGRQKRNSGRKSIFKLKRM